MYSNSCVYLALSHIACIAGRWGGGLSRFCSKGFIPNSGEYGAGAERTGNVLILCGSTLGALDGGDVMRKSRLMNTAERGLITVRDTFNYPSHKSQRK